MKNINNGEIFWDFQWLSLHQSTKSELCIAKFAHCTDHLKLKGHAVGHLLRPLQDKSEL